MKEPRNRQATAATIAVTVAEERRKSNISDSTDHANEQANHEPKSTRLVIWSACISDSYNAMVCLVFLSAIITVSKSYVLLACMRSSTVGRALQTLHVDIYRFDVCKANVRALVYLSTFDKNTRAFTCSTV